MIALLVITDGRRDYIRDTVASAAEHLDGRDAAPIVERWMYDDSGDPEHHQWLIDTFPDFEFIPAGERLGFSGAIRHSWAHLRAQSDCDYIFHLEDDFTFNRRIPLGAIASTLETDLTLAQIALRRQPWNDAERAAGGVVEMAPDEYTETTGPFGTYLRHRMFFTTNPSLYRVDLIGDNEWPDVPRSEGMFSIQLLRESYEFAFWGPRDSGEWVTHNGAERAGTGY